MAEGLEVALVNLRIGSCEGGEIVVVAVQALPAGDELETPEEQVEAVRRCRPGRVRVGVEGPLDHRVAGHEEEVRAVLAGRPLAEPSFVGGREVGLTDDLLPRVRFDELLGQFEVDGRDPSRYHRQLDAELRDVVRGSLGDRLHHSVDHVPQHDHDVGVVGDESHLGIERDVFGEMASGVVGFGSEHRTDLVHALEHADHHLLVELGALREVSRSPEPVDREDVRSTLRRRLDHLGRVDLGEVALVERGPEPVDRCRGERGGRSPSRVTERHGRVIQKRRELHRKIAPS